MNPPVDQINWNAKSPRREPSVIAAPFCCTHAGWTINTPPPDIGSSGLHGRGMGSTVLLQRASSGFVPWETINPCGARGVHLRSDAPVYRVDGNQFWSTVWCFSSRPIKFTLNLPRRCDVTFSLVIRACGAIGCMLDVIVNGHTLESYRPAHDLWFMLDVKIPASHLQSGANHIVLETPTDVRRAPRPNASVHRSAYNSPADMPLGVWIQSASVSSRAVPMSVSFQWVPLCSGLVEPNETVQRTVQISQGNLSSPQETESFARQLDVEACPSDGDLLSNLNEVLTHAYSWGSAAAHPVAIEPLHTVEHALHIGPGGAKGVTYRLWQLDLIFQANGRRLVQALGANGPIITQQLPARNSTEPI